MSIAKRQSFIMRTVTGSSWPASCTAYRFLRMQKILLGNHNRRTASWTSPIGTGKLS